MSGSPSFDTYTPLYYPRDEKETLFKLELHPFSITMTKHLRQGNVMMKSGLLNSWFWRF
jgi:hypothetical protein